MTRRRKKWTPDLMLRINAVRTALANQYGNLYGMKFRDWFVFNGHVAGIYRSSLRKFELALEARRKSRGVSANHRARRARESQGIYIEKPAPLPVRRRRWSRQSPIQDGLSRQQRRQAERAVLKAAA